MEDIEDIETDSENPVNSYMPLISVALIPAYFMSMIIGVSLFNLQGSKDPSNDALFIGMAVNALLWIGLTYFYIQKVPFKEMEKSLLEEKVSAFIVGVISIFGIYLIFTGINYLTQRFMGYTPEPQELTQRITATTPKEYFLLIMTPILLVPIVEEIIFRGFIYRSLKDVSKPMYAAIISAALFALVHGEVRAMPLLFALGLIFAFAYEKTGSMAVPALLHAANNFFTIAVLLWKN